MDGIGMLFAEYGIEGAQPALDALAKQLTDYETWARTTVLPEARTDATLSPELYAFQLKQFGIDIDPQLLIDRAQVEFMETRAAMAQLAPLVAEAKGLEGIDDGDYVAVLRWEGRRVGKECVRKCRSRWSQFHSKKK